MTIDYPVQLLERESCNNRLPRAITLHHNVVVPLALAAVEGKCPGIPLQSTQETNMYKYVQSNRIKMKFSGHTKLHSAQYQKFFLSRYNTTCTVLQQT